MKPRRAEHKMRQEVISRVQEVIKQLWPTAEVRRENSHNLPNFLSYIQSKFTEWCNKYGNWRGFVFVELFQVEVYGSFRTGLYLPTRWEQVATFCES